MKGKIMDKKILLSGAAALVLGASLYAAPASASALSLTIEGEGAVTATMDDNCSVSASDLDANTAITVDALNASTGHSNTAADTDAVLAIAKEAGYSISADEIQQKISETSAADAELEGAAGGAAAYGWCAAMGTFG